MNGRRYAFFAHFNRVNMQRGDARVWTVHYRGVCYQATEIVFWVPVRTRYVANGKQPRATLRGYARHVAFEGTIVVVR